MLVWVTARVRLSALNASHSKVAEWRAGRCLAAAWPVGAGGEAHKVHLLSIVSGLAQRAARTLNSPLQVARRSSSERHP